MHPPQKKTIIKKKKINRAFLVVQWLRLCVSNPNAGNTGLIPGQGRHYMPQQKKKKVKILIIIIIIGLPWWSSD